MKATTKTLLYFTLIIAIISFTSWGFLVHRTVQQLAIYELPSEMRSFFYHHKDKLVYDAVRPDIRRSKDTTEATKHFIDLEAYGKNAAFTMPLHWNEAVKKYSKDSLLKYGYVPYHVIYMKEKLTAAFKNNNKDSILFYASDIGHYISDAHVPLHTTMNYDGQLTNQKGLHSLWESMIPELELDHYDLYAKHKAQYLKHPEQKIWMAVRTAAALVPDLLEKEKQVSANFSDAQKFRKQIRKGKEFKSYTSEFAQAYSNSLQNTVHQQLISAANLIADFYYTAWVDAGKPSLDPTSGYEASENALLKEEMLRNKKNELIVSGKLLAKKVVEKD